MAPLIPRMHVFEIDDQTWFPPWFRRRVQAALTRAWTTKVPLLQSASPAEIVADVLRREVLADGSDDNDDDAAKAAGSPGPRRPPWTMVDFCAGGGGPTPSIERIVNGPAQTKAHDKATRFVLTDLHPHVDEWTVAAADRPHLRFVPDPVDASAADPAALVASTGPQTNGVLPPPRICRLFHLAFHHFDDPLARAILRNTVETSDAFGIFELQDRSLGAFVTTLVFGLGILLTAPYYAWQWGSPLTLVFTYLVPVLPFVLVFDGWMSMLRTRTPDEVAALLHTSGATPADVDQWDLRSGATRHLWPCGYVKWIVGVKR